MSGPAGGSYGLNVTAFLADYGDRWWLTAGPGGEGYTARRRGGRATFSALTLDQLAQLLDREDRPPASPAP